jgi:pyrophosphatase PpaX
MSMQNRFPVEALLFDVDGTLIDTVELIVQSLAYTYQKHLGAQLSREELRRLIGLPLSVQMRYLDDRIAKPADYTAMEADEIAYYEANKQLEQVIPEAVQAVRVSSLKGLKTALVTSKNRMELSHTLPRLELDGVVGAVVSADDSARPKPAPDPVLRALELLQVDAGNAIFIGDTVYDLTCGRAAGVQVAAVAWGAHLPEDLHAMQPDYYFETPVELLKWIEQLPDWNHYGSSQENEFKVTRTGDYQ